jgi:glutaredoxin
MSQPDETKHIERFVSSHPVVLFGRYTCEYTAKARQLLQEMRVPFKEVDIEAQGTAQRPSPLILGAQTYVVPADGGQQLWDALKAKTGQNTTPYVFINKQFEQGFDRTCLSLSNIIHGNTTSRDAT